MDSTSIFSISKFNLPFHKTNYYFLVVLTIFYYGLKLYLGYIKMNVFWKLPVFEVQNNITSGPHNLYSLER